MSDNEARVEIEAIAETKPRIASKKRTTKVEKIAFLNWYFDDENHENVKDASGGSISQLYQKHCGIIVSPTFVNRNRVLYNKHNGEIVKNSLVNIA